MSGPLSMVTRATEGTCTLERLDGGNSCTTLQFGKRQKKAGNVYLDNPLH